MLTSILAQGFEFYFRGSSFDIIEMLLEFHQVEQVAVVMFLIVSALTNIFT